MKSRRRLRAAIAAAAVGILPVVLAACGGGDPAKQGDVPGLTADTTTTTADTTAGDGPSPLKPHPRIVIAAAPGQLPPGAQFADATTEGQQVQPPSDAEVRRELRQLQSANVGSGAYVDPFSHISGLVPERIDMGVDYQGTGPVLALGSGTVFNTAGAGWPGGYFIGITLDSGPFAGLSYFVAEDVKPAVKVGDHVRAGQVIGVMYGGPAGIETGWAAGRGDQPLAAALGQQASGDPGGWTSAAGASFDRVLVSTGTPSGIPQGPKVHGKMPRPYP